MDANHTNGTHSGNEIIYPELSYVLTGVCFDAHNELGRYSREKQYGDEIEKRIKEAKISYKREFSIGGTGNIVDFLIDNKIILEIKAKRVVTREDYYQTQRYLQALDARLGLLVNFRSKYLKPVRIVKIETANRSRFV